MIDNSYHSNIMWAHWFLKRNGYAKRNITDTGQEIKKESNLYTGKFFKNIFTIRYILNIYSNLNQIGYTDESAIYYENIYPTTIAHIGEKSANVKDKIRITAVLTILVDGTKLPPLLVFRWKNYGPKEKTLQKNYNVSKGNILVKCHENAWLNNDLFMFWLNIIWFSASLKKSVSNSLQLDHSTTYFYKDWINNGNMKPPSEDQIIDLFTNIWYNKVKRESIFNSFKKLVFLLKWMVLRIN